MKIIKFFIIFSLIIQFQSYSQDLEFIEDSVTFNYKPHYVIFYSFKGLSDSSYLMPNITSDTINYSDYIYKLFPYIRKFDKSLYYKISNPMNRTNYYFLKSYIHSISKWIVGIFIIFIIFILIKIYGENENN